MDVAVLATKSNHPSTRKQFQSGWKQAERYFARNHLGSKMFRAVARNFSAGGQMRVSEVSRTS